MDAFTWLLCSCGIPYSFHLFTFALHCRPWLVVGLFAAPALLGAVICQHIGYIILSRNLWQISFKREDQRIPDDTTYLIKLEIEMWLFNGGFIQWLALLILGSYYEVGPTYMANSFGFCQMLLLDGLMEATLTPMRSPKPLKTATLLLGAMRSIVLGFLVLFCLTLSAVLTGAVPPFHDDHARAVNVSLAFSATSFRMLV
ncbi:hypothetical protein Scep_014859 [Stephania cephalantha]|uniref:Uncharacterized protein n=1 Tax=Stephania cephalantha TaxID=152367 RepID=A0AAP0J248_9MAGN